LRLRLGKGEAEVSRPCAPALAFPCAAALALMRGKGNAREGRERVGEGLA